MIGGIVALAFTLAIVFTAVFFVRPSITRDRAGKILAFFCVFLLPATAVVSGGFYHLERSKQTEFCLSCHVMTPYGESLQSDDPGLLAASHFQNHRVDPGRACYACHTRYTIYGDLSAKWNGLKHLYVNYAAGPPPTEKLRLYEPFNNRECLYCHAGARSFEENAVHSADAETLAGLKSNTISCLTAGCHDTAHRRASRKEARR